MIYKFAVQNKLRFPSTKGELNIEQLFDLPLTSNSGASLDVIARTINSDIKALGEESFVDTGSNPQKKLLEQKLEILKDVIKTRQDENAARISKTKKAEERRKILDAMSAKKDQLLSQASLEDLEKKLAELD